MFFGNSNNKFTSKDEDDMDCMIDAIEAFVDGTMNDITFKKS